MEKDMKNAVHPMHKAIVDCIFGGEAGKADSIAVEGVIYNLQNPETMTREVFLQLQNLAAGVEQPVAQDHDFIDGLDKLLEEVARLLDAAPWPAIE